jgi:hypothetical protein
LFTAIYYIMASPPEAVPNPTAPKIGADPIAKPAPETLPLAAEGQSLAPPPPSAPPTAAKPDGAAPAEPVLAVTDDDGVNPLDFQGAVESNHNLPSAELIRKIDNYMVLDRDGKSHTFRSLYTGRHTARRVLIVFVRHFYCGVNAPSPPPLSTFHHA